MSRGNAYGRNTNKRDKIKTEVRTLDLEYLIIGIAKEQEGDFEEFYRRTCAEVFGLALAYVKDRFLAREVAVEAYRRVKKLAYKFDSDMNGEYWLMDIVKNLCINALCDGEISRIAALRRMENLTHLLRQAISETDEDRGKILMLRVATGLSKGEVATLLWYQRASADGEFVRGIRQLIPLQPEPMTAEEVKKQLHADLAACTPDYFSLILSEKETLVASFSHKNSTAAEDELALPGESAEARKERIKDQHTRKRKKRIIAVSATVSAVIIAILSGVLIWYFASNGDSLLREPDEDTLSVTEPQYNTRVALYEQNGVLYFQNLAQGGQLFRIDMTQPDSSAEKISADMPKEMVSDGTYLYYRNEGSGRFYRIALSGGESTMLGTPYGSLLRIHGDRLYFSSRNGISSTAKDGSDPQTLLEITGATQLLREDIEIAEDGTVYFSGGATSGLYRLVEKEDGYVYEPVAGGYIYDFSISGNYLFFDELSGDGTGVIRRVDIGPENTSDVVSMRGVLLSAAFFVKDQYIYYYGYADGGAESANAEKGIYRILTDGTSSEDNGAAYGGEPQLVLSLAGSSYDVSDIYVSNGFLYCYFCSGEKEKSYMRLDAYALGDDGLLAGSAENARVIFSSGKG